MASGQPSLKPTLSQANPLSGNPLSGNPLSGNPHSDQPSLWSTLSLVKPSSGQPSLRSSLSLANPLSGHPSLRQPSLRQLSLKQPSLTQANKGQPSLWSTLSLAGQPTAIRDHLGTVHIVLVILKIRHFCQIDYCETDTKA